jgi:proteic killer suppression protein
MLVTFEHNYLQELYQSGKTSDKKHRFQPDIVTKYKRCIDVLISANNIESLYKINSLKYETLVGDKNGISAIRVNDQYRIEFVVIQMETESIITVCNIIELSNYYK